MEFYIQGHSLLNPAAFRRLWLQHYSAPEMVVTDLGPEFIGGSFTAEMGKHAILHHHIDSQSPWQQGRTERAGGVLKDMILKVMESVAIASKLSAVLTNP